MAVQIFYKNEEIKQHWINFSDGASNVRLDEFKENKDVIRDVTVTVLPTTPVDNILWELVQVFSALRSWYEHVRIHLHMPYLPNARADRQFEDNMSSPLHEFLCFVYSFLEPETIFIVDPHSDVYTQYPNYENRIMVKPQYQCFKEVVDLDKREEFWVVAPDKGATQKTLELINHLTQQQYKVMMIQCDKVRDVSTGQITDFYVPGVELRNRRAIIVDDICDGGGTFIPIAKKLKEQGASRVDLYVTHGIFSKGLDLFKDHFNQIYVYQHVSSYINAKHVLDFNYRQR